MVRDRLQTRGLDSSFRGAAVAGSGCRQTTVSGGKDFRPHKLHKMHPADEHSAAQPQPKELTTEAPVFIRGFVFAALLPPRTP